MGEVVRERVLRALGLGKLWVQLEALSVRLRRVEQDLERVRLERRPETLRAAPPPPPEEGER
jgi:hypothetical protein